MKVLVACEESQTVCKAFRELGHEAYSNDVIECSGGHPEWHLQMDCFEAIKSSSWDLIIMHPPCTAMTVSGNSTYGEGKPKHHERINSVKWTQELWELAKSVCGKVAMENPVGVLNRYGNFPKPSYIQPYQFGHMETKKTGLWLHGIEPLTPTSDLKEKTMALPERERMRLHYLPPSKDRAKLRSKTYDGIAKAMAEQWGGKIND